MWACGRCSMLFRLSQQRLSRMTGAWMDSGYSWLVVGGGGLGAGYMFQYLICSD